MKHDRAYHRFKTSIKQRRKMKMNRWIGFNYVPGYFRKGKIHCSCPMCSIKTNRNGHKISEFKKLQDMKELAEIYGHDAIKSARHYKYRKNYY